MKKLILKILEKVFEFLFFCFIYYLVFFYLFHVEENTFEEWFSVPGILLSLFAISPLPKLLSKKSPRRKFRSLPDIDTMEGHDFEYLCAELLKRQGFSQVQVTRGSGDQGVDILAQKGNQKYAIQCKRYSSPLGNSPVQEVYTGKVFYGCDVAAVLTNQYFTSSAKSLAEKTGVLLWDRDCLIEFIRSSQRKKLFSTIRSKILKKSALYSGAVREQPHEKD